MTSSQRRRRDGGGRHDVDSVVDALDGCSPCCRCQRRANATALYSAALAAAKRTKIGRQLAVSRLTRPSEHPAAAPAKVAATLSPKPRSAFSALKTRFHTPQTEPKKRAKTAELRSSTMATSRLRDALPRDPINSLSESASALMAKAKPAALTKASRAWCTPDEGLAPPPLIFPSSNLRCERH